MWRPVIAALVALVVVAACGGTTGTTAPSAPPAALEPDGPWQLVEGTVGETYVTFNVSEGA